MSSAQMQSLSQHKALSTVGFSPLNHTRDLCDAYASQHRDEFHAEVNPPPAAGPTGVNRISHMSKD